MSPAQKKTMQAMMQKMLLSAAENSNQSKSVGNNKSGDSPKASDQTVVNARKDKETKQERSPNKAPENIKLVVSGRPTGGMVAQSFKPAAKPKRKLVLAVPSPSQSDSGASPKASQQKNKGKKQKQVPTALENAQPAVVATKTTESTKAAVRRRPTGGMVARGFKPAAQSESKSVEQVSAPENAKPEVVKSESDVVTKTTENTKVAVSRRPTGGMVARGPKPAGQSKSKFVEQVSAPENAKPAVVKSESDVVTKTIESTKVTVIRRPTGGMVARGPKPAAKSKSEFVEQVSAPENTKPAVVGSESDVAAGDNCEDESATSFGSGSEEDDEFVRIPCQIPNGKWEMITFNLAEVKQLTTNAWFEVFVTVKTSFFGNGEVRQGVRQALRSKFVWFIIFYHSF